MNTQRAAHATRAYRAGSRRRAARAAIEQAVDATIASGGLLLANAAFDLGIGLPDGRTGLSLGTLLIGGGVAWIARHRARRHAPEPRRATIAAMRAQVPQPQLRSVSRAA